MALKSELETLIEEMEREGKVTKLPPEQVAKIKEGLARDLAEYRAENAIRHYRSEQDLMRTVLNV